jgi:DNA modification methylase
MKLNTIYNENCLDTVRRMPDGFIDCVVTSPPYYGLRCYNHDEQFGLEKTPEAFVKNLVDLFREIRRALKDTGSVWLNLGDSYASVKSRYSSRPHTLSGGKDRGDSHNKKPDLYHYAKQVGIKDKDLIGIPWMVAFALRADGWYLRQDIIWHKPNPMPESVTDRCTKSHEYIFLLTKSQRYFYDSEAVKEKANYDGRKDTVMKGSQKYNTAVVPGQAAHTFAVGGHERWQMNENGDHVRNKRSVWTVTTKPFKDAHFATFPEDLIVPCIKAGTSEKGCCPKCGKPWERVVDRKRMARNEFKPGDPRYRPNTYKGAHGDINGKADAGYTETTTIGWQPACECGDHTPVPAIVYDPFMGAATTAVVAHKLNRNWIGSELNPDYVEITEKRLKPYITQIKMAI